MTLDDAFAELHQLAARWRGDADRRRSLWSADPVASTLGHAAEELAAEIQRLEMEGSRLTVKEYARQRGVSPQSVTRWIRRGYLPASRTPDGYSISRGAKMTRRRAA